MPKRVLIQKWQNDRPHCPIASRKRTENKNKYLSTPYLDPCQVDNLTYLRSCNIPFTPDKSF